MASAVGGQKEALALRGNVLLFAQRLQLSAAGGRSGFLQPPGVSSEQSKTWDAQEERERPEAQSQTQVRCPAGGDTGGVRAEREEDETQVTSVPGRTESAFHCWLSQQ